MVRENYMTQVTATEFAKKIGEKHGLSNKESKEIVQTFLDTLVSEVKSGSKVAFLGFGSFEKGHRKERQSTNPSTGEKMTISATDYPKFKAGTAFKKALNG